MGLSKANVTGRCRSSLERRRNGEGADQGFTLVELMIAMTITAIILTLSTTIISSYFNNGTQINSAYQGFDEVIPSTTGLQQYFITMVEPATPTVASGAFTPIPPFSYNPPTESAGNNPALPAGFQLSPNSATFTSNTGDPNGPGLVQISTTANAAPKNGNPQTSTLIATLTPADPGTCPDVTSGTKCTWGVTTTPKRIATVNDLINGATNATTPVLQYATTTSGGIVSPYSTTAGSTWQTTFGPGSCSSQGNCPADQITAVTIAIQIQPPGKQTTVYQTTVTPFSISYATNVG
jgi:prepilin-type N-terminal cleavage/methylation domain-containing protein